MKSNLTIAGERAWSYRTQIRGVLPDGRVILNVTKYSVTTSKHQTLAARHFGDYCPRPDRYVLVDAVPTGTDNLEGWYARYVGTGPGVDKSTVR